MDLFGNKLLTRARFYEALAATLDAGLPVDQALSSALGDDELGLAPVIEQVRGGRSLADALSAVDKLPPWEVMIVETGEQSGRLPVALGRLGEHLSSAAVFRRRLAWKLAYPVGLLHGAMVLPTLPVLVQSGVAAYAGVAGTALLGLYAVAFICWLAARQAPDTFWWSMPVVGKLVRSRAVADYAFVLGSLFSAGTPLPEALRTAAGFGPSSVRAAGRRVALAVHRGGDLGESLALEQDVFGDMLVKQIKVGEAAGKLEDMLHKAESFARGEAEQAAKQLAVALVFVAGLAAALVVAWVVIGFWSGYARSLNV